MPDSGKLKLTNARTTKKEALPNANPLHVYLPLPPNLYPSGNRPSLTDFSSLVALRLYFFASLLTRVVQIEKRKLEFVQKPQQAGVVVYGDPLLVSDAGLPSAEARFPVKVEGVLFKGEGNQEGPEIIRNYSFDEIQYLTYGTSYRQPLILSDAALSNARQALARMHDYAERFAAETGPGAPRLTAKKADLDDWRARFYQQVQDDLNLPRALAVVWLMFQSNLGPGDKLALLTEFDRVLGLGVAVSAPVIATPVEARPTNGYAHATLKEPSAKEKERDKARPEPPKREESRNKERSSGKPPKNKLVTGVEGQAANKAQKSGTKGKPQPGQKGQPDQPKPERRKIQDTRQVRSFLDQADRFDFTVSLLAHDNLGELRATVESLLFYTTRGQRRVEVVAVDLGSQDGSTEYLDGVAASYANFRVMLASPNLGEAAGRNLALRQGRGRFMLLLDAGLTLGGDLFEALFSEVSKDERPALYGIQPLQLKRGPNNEPTGFEPLPLTGKEQRMETEAVEGSLLCFRRALADEAGFMDEHFRLPYALDLDYSFAFRDKGFAVVALPALARLVNRPAGFSRSTYNLAPEETERQKQKNWNLFKKSWGL